MTTTCSPWATPADVCAPCAGDEFDGSKLADCLQYASDVLYELTGRRWAGSCTDTIRPCGVRGADACRCGRSPSACGCGGVSEIRLPSTPATAVTSVTIDGVVVDEARYRLDDGRFLVYQPDEDNRRERQAWPCCQRLDRPAGAEDTWSITYTYGEAPPIGGVMAAASLACELALACQPDTVGKCRLPKRVTAITRQGVSLAVLDPLTLFSEGKTGLAEVDLWVGSLRAGQKNRRATVMLPGRRPARRTT